MIYRQLDDNGDYTFGSGLANYYHNTPDGVAQAVQTRLKLWSGEWFLDITDGVPFMGGILGKYTGDTINQLIAQVVLDTTGVLSIVSFSGVYNGDDRSYHINAVIDTIYGTANIYGAF